MTASLPRPPTPTRQLDAATEEVVPETTRNLRLLGAHPHPGVIQHLGAHRLASHADRGAPRHVIRRGAAFLMRQQQRRRQQQQQRQQRAMGQNQVILRHQKFTFPRARE